MGGSRYFELEWKILVGQTDKHSLVIHGHNCNSPNELNLQ